MTMKEEPVSLILDPVDNVQVHDITGEKVWEGTYDEWAELTRKLTSAKPTDWCEQHDLPFRTIRTANDRVVCWYIWWYEILERDPEGYIATHPDMTNPLPCRHGERLVVTP